MNWGLGMGKFIDLTGSRFGLLTVVSRAENYEKFSKTHNRVLKYARWNCVCDCGQESLAVLATDLKSSSQISCGCVRDSVAAARVRVHGMRYSSEYGSWLAMKDRCLNENSGKYSAYGDMGITIYEPWKYSFEEFYKYVGPKPSSRHSIDRINSEGNYEPGNVKWSLPAEQAQNTRKPKNGKNRYKWVKKVSSVSWQGIFMIDGVLYKTKTFENERSAAQSVYLLYKEIVGIYPKYWPMDDIIDLELPYE